LYCVTPSNHRIHTCICWESVSRRDVRWSRRHDDVAYTMYNYIYENMLFLEARLETWRVTTACIANDNQYLLGCLKRAGRQRLWLASWWCSISHWFGGGVSWKSVVWRSDAIPQVGLDGFQWMFYQKY
jgi:hypothetical protein